MDKVDAPLVGIDVEHFSQFLRAGVKQGFTTRCRPKSV
jgi:hypothetical protein